jgi:hypothetical protein
MIHQICAKNVIEGSRGEISNEYQRFDKLDFRQDSRQKNSRQFADGFMVIDNAMQGLWFRFENET